MGCPIVREEFVAGIVPAKLLMNADYSIKDAKDLLRNDLVANGEPETSGYVITISSRHITILRGGAVAMGINYKGPKESIKVLARYLREEFGNHVLTQ